MKDIKETYFYRINLGKILRAKRIDNLYTIEDIVYMTGISKSTVIKIEKGEAKIIDNYVEYAKAVKYPLATLNDFKIPLIPLNKLPNDRLEAVNLTAKIREHIVRSNFLNKGKTVAEIKDELIKLRLVSKDIKSVAIAGVMRNLKDDGLVTTGDKIGRKEVYLKP